MRHLGIEFGSVYTKVVLLGADGDVERSFREKSDADETRFWENVFRELTRAYPVDRNLQTVSQPLG